MAQSHGAGKEELGLLHGEKLSLKLLDMTKLGLPPHTVQISRDTALGCLPS